jgi:hypothetical protein
MQNPSQMQQDQQRRQWEQRTKTIVTIEAVAPTAESFTQLAQQFQQTPGLKEVSLRRESDGRPRIRIQATQESLSSIQQVLSQVVQTVQQAYGSQQQYAGSSAT